MAGLGYVEAETRSLPLTVLTRIPGGGETVIGAAASAFRCDKSKLLQDGFQRLAGVAFTDARDLFGRAGGLNFAAA
jgi:hypothetical protein